MPTFEEFLTSQSAKVPLAGFVVNLVLAVVLALVLRWLYVRFGRSLSNRQAFSRNFVLLAITTTIIITVVKSSLALSLGLVGALSIVRFRAAVKEPEELAYLFLTIAIGLGLGADQRELTLVGLAVVVGVTWMGHKVGRDQEDQNLVLTISSKGDGKIDLSRIVEGLRRHCSEVNLKRFDESQQAVEARFHVAFAGVEALQACRTELLGLDESVMVSILDQEGII